MSQTTVNLGLPYILPAQAQKHVTHNEAIQRLDAAVQLVLQDRLATPPGSPEEGECYGILAGATGAWSGRDGQIAFRQDGAWIFLQPKTGWRAFAAAEAELMLYTGGAWQPAPLPDNGAFQTLGVNATADSGNRFALSSAASLFNHAGNGHQLKVNKQSASDTASLLYQTAWQGRAEMGLAGNDDFSLKVSPDGSTWTTALAVSSDGVVHTPARPLVRTSLATGVSTPASGDRSGFDTLYLLQGGFSLGSAVPSGVGNRLVVPVAGIYHLNLNLVVQASTSHEARILKNGSVVLASISGHNDGGPAMQQSTATLAPLEAGDWLCLEHIGNAQIDFGSGRTEVTAALL